jgi:hypothetical protein
MSTLAAHLQQQQQHRSNKPPSTQPRLTKPPRKQQLQKQNQKKAPLAQKSLVLSNSPSHDFQQRPQRLERSNSFKYVYLKLSINPFID